MIHVQNDVVGSAPGWHCGVLCLCDKARIKNVQLQVDRFLVLSTNRNQFRVAKEK